MLSHLRLQAVLLYAGCLLFAFSPSELRYICCILGGKKHHSADAELLTNA